MCAEVRRGALICKKGTFPERIFREDSEYLGTRVLWSKGKWNWNLDQVPKEDVSHVRRLLALACPALPTLVVQLASEGPKVKEYAGMWGFL